MNVHFQKKICMVAYEPTNLSVRCSGAEIWLIQPKYT